MASIEAPAPPSTPDLSRSRTRPRRPGRARRGLLGTSVANVAGVLFTIVMAFPAYWMINTAFKPSNEVLTFTPHFLPEHPTFSSQRRWTNPLPRTTRS